VLARSAAGSAEEPAKPTKEKSSAWKERSAAWKQRTARWGKRIKAVFSWRKQKMTEQSQQAPGFTTRTAIIEKPSSGGLGLQIEFDQVHLWQPVTRPSD